MSEWTIQKLLAWITGYLTERNVDAPRLSAELLLSHVLGLKRIELYTHFHQVVEPEHREQLRDLVRRAGLHEPVAHLVGRTEFYSLELDVTPDCLIPRPETELLVQRAIEYLRRRGGRPYVCDLCTGCGCIAAAVAKSVPDAKVVATDISSAALCVAARNVEKHGLEERVAVLVSPDTLNDHSLTHRRSWYAERDQHSQDEHDMSPSRPRDNSPVRVHRCPHSATGPILPIAATALARTCASSDARSSAHSSAVRP